MWLQDVISSMYLNFQLPTHIPVVIQVLAASRLQTAAALRDAGLSTPVRLAAFGDAFSMTE